MAFISLTTSLSKKLMFPVRGIRSLPCRHSWRITPSLALPPSLRSARRKNLPFTRRVYGADLTTQQMRNEVQESGGPRDRLYAFSAGTCMGCLLRGMQTWNLLFKSFFAFVRYFCLCKGSDAADLQIFICYLGT